MSRPSTGRERVHAALHVRLFLSADGNDARGFEEMCLLSGDLFMQAEDWQRVRFINWMLTPSAVLFGYVYRAG